MMDSSEKISKKSLEHALSASNALYLRIRKIQRGGVATWAGEATGLAFGVYDRRCKGEAHA